MVSDQTQAQLFPSYMSNDFFYKELLDNNGNPRAHWQTFFKSLGKLSQAELGERCKEIEHFLKENGVTYNIYGDPQGLSRAWKLDPIPYIVGVDEWQTIGRGLEQRAELLNLLLKDIYGEQELIKKGILPLELIYHHAGFLRPSVGISTKRRHSLKLYAADVARTNDGKIWLVNDRTQAPSGSGYAFENRTAMARIMPELFEGLRVLRLGQYFDSLHSAFHQLAPVQKPNIRVVILTPGPDNETYFEHCYLSSFLGFTLVEGNDLIVKDKIVWLKTIGGLERVDVIIRRVDDEYCDPLELKEVSQLGVAGLLQAVRAGNVTVANPLGSSILENPGIIPFLPSVSKYFFNEPLILPTVASWWCGQEKEMKYVLANLPKLVIKRIHPNNAGSSSINPSLHTSKEIAELKEKIKAFPYLYVGQEKIDFAPTPSLKDGKLQPTRALFRSFLVSDGDKYTIMPGGLTRTSANNEDGIISNQMGGMSKDTWILSPEKDYGINVRREVSMPHPAAPLGLLPSHTAENLFWVGRYTERILGNARFIRTVMKRVAEGNKYNEGSEISIEHRLLEALTRITYTYPGFTDPNTCDELFQNPWAELESVLFDNKRSGSLSYSLILFNRAVHAVRDHWSTDTWRVLKDLDERWAASAKCTNNMPSKLIHALDDLITSLVAFVGLNRESISREQGWFMLDLGRKMEQTMLLISTLRNTLVWKYEEQVEYGLQEAVLVSNECLANYRYRYRAHLQLSLVIELMVLDRNNPRSLMYQVARLKGYISGLPKPDNGMGNHEAAIVEIYNLLQTADSKALAYLEECNLEYCYLEDFLKKISELLFSIPSAISSNYFLHAQSQSQIFTHQAG